MSNLEKKLKCFYCNKNLSLIEELTAKCKCNNYYCIRHKYPENHKCSIDYIDNNKIIMKKNLITFDT